VLDALNPPLPLLAALALVAGWVLGWLSARATNSLLAAAGDPLPGPARGWLLDPYVQAGCALAWGVLALRLLPQSPEPWRFLATAALAVPLVQISVTDFRLRIVFTHVAYAAAAAGVLLSPLLHPATVWWLGPVQSVLGAVGGFLAFLFLWWLGKRLYGGVEAMAWGDVLIAGMVGAIAGPETLQALFLGILASGLLAAGTGLVRRTLKVYMPYGPGLCLGAFLTFLTP
jgi:hypothetical protein